MGTNLEGYIYKTGCHQRQCDAVEKMRKELSEHYGDVSDIMVSEFPKGLYLCAQEGTGARFHSMIEIFKVLELFDHVEILTS